MNMMMASFINAYQHISSLWLFIFSISLQINRINSVSPAEIEKHLELGRELLARGQLTDALSHYHAAVEGDPTNYLTYFKRATVYLALAKSRSALPDLNKVIELKPDFTAAKIQRGLVLLKQGRLDEAHIDFEQVLQKEPHNQEAIQHYNSIEPIKRDIEIAAEYMQDRNYFPAIDLLTRVLEVCPWNPKLKEMRAECYEKIGDLEKAIHDIKPTTKLRNDNTEAYLKLSQLYYSLGEAEDSLNEIRECLKLDPEHKDCFPFYKKVKKLASHIKSIKEYIGEQRYDDCVAKAEQMLKLEPHVKQFVLQATSQKCHCLVKGNQVKEGIDQCTEAINIEENPFNLCDRADAYIANEQYEEAIHDYQRAVNLDEDLKRAHEGLSRAQKLLKQSKKRDYYKILGVRRTASKRDILKAYRKLAQKWHPDNFQGDEKKKAENKFIDIAAAKEVLTDPEKREKYDNGEDPLDPESQAGQGFNPFAQGFHPFGNGPFQFRFHFN